MRLLLTRPLVDALPLKSRLEAAGCAVTLAPMMTIEYLNAPIDLAGVQTLLFTSANGVRAFTRLSTERDIPAYCVGRGTAALAEQTGFTAIHVSGGDAAALAEDAILGLNPGSGTLLHLGGATTRGGLGERLAAAGFEYRKQALYTAEPVSHLAVEARDALEAGALDAALFYSPRTARLFRARVAEAGLDGRLSAMDAYCLSPAVAEALAGLAWRRVLTAERPDEAALLSLMGIAG